MSRRLASISRDQKKILSEYMKKNELLAKGKFTSDFTHKDAQAKWKEITKIMNANPGAEKDWYQWRKTWHDLKKNAKSRHCELKKYNEGTRSGPSPPDIDAFDMEIIKFVGDTSVSDDRRVSESSIEFKLSDTEETCLSENANALSDTDLNIEPDVKIFKHTEEPSQANVPKLPLSQPKGLRTIAEERNHIKREYYERKLALMEEKIKTKKEIVSAINSLSKNVAKLVDSIVELI